MILTLDYWNGIITDINALAVSPPMGCDAVSTLSLATDPTILTDVELERLRAKLRQICIAHDFSAETVYWTQDIIDELEQAVDDGWCNCGGTQNILTWYWPIRIVDELTNYSFNLGGGGPPSSPGSIGFPYSTNVVTRTEDYLQQQIDEGDLTNGNYTAEIRRFHEDIDGTIQSYTNGIFGTLASNALLTSFCDFDPPAFDPPFDDLIFWAPGKFGTARDNTGIILCSGHADHNTGDGNGSFFPNVYDRDFNVSAGTFTWSSPATNDQTHKNYKPYMEILLQGGTVPSNSNIQTWTSSDANDIAIQLQQRFAKTRWEITIV